MKDQNEQIEKNDDEGHQFEARPSRSRRPTSRRTISQQVEQVEEPDVEGHMFEQVEQVEQVE